MVIYKPPDEGAETQIVHNVMASRLCWGNNGFSFAFEDGPHYHTDRILAGLRYGRGSQATPADSVNRWHLSTMVSTAACKPVHSSLIRTTTLVP